MKSCGSKNNNFVFNVGTSSLEAKKLEIYSLSIESYLLFRNLNSNCQSFVDFFSDHRFHVGQIHTFLDRPLKVSIGVCRLGLSISPETSTRIFHGCHQFFISFNFLHFYLNVSFSISKTYRQCNREL